MKCCTPYAFRETKKFWIRHACPRNAGALASAATIKPFRGPVLSAASAATTRSGGTADRAACAAPGAVGGPALADFYSMEGPDDVGAPPKMRPLSCGGLGIATQWATTRAGYLRPRGHLVYICSIKTTFWCLKTSNLSPMFCFHELIGTIIMLNNAKAVCDSEFVCVVGSAANFSLCKQKRYHQLHKRALIDSNKVSHSGYGIGYAQRRIAHTRINVTVDSDTTTNKQTQMNK